MIDDINDIDDVWEQVNKIRSEAKCLIYRTVSLNKWNDKKTIDCEIKAIEKHLGFIKEKCDTIIDFLDDQVIKEAIARCDEYRTQNKL